MIPVLYNEEETEFITQGIGALSDAISCKVVEELNGSYELTMQYPVTGLHFSDIILNRLILADHAPNRQSEPFQIYKISKPINGVVTIYAEHISYRLSYIPVSPFTANTCVEALNGLKEHADEPCQFTLYTDKSTIAEYKQIIPHSFRELLGGVDGSILDTYRGEYEFNRFNIRFTQHRGVYKKSASIRYGKNLTDLKQEESIENTVTGIYPYWQGTKTITSTSSDGETVSKTEDVVVTLPEKIIYSENKDKYSYHRTIPKDFAYRFQDKPTEAQLRVAAQSYVKEIGVPEVNLTVSFLSLASMEENKHFSDETVYLGDTVPIEFIKLGIMTDAEIIKATYDTLMDRYDTLELGTTSSSLSKTIVAMQKKYESAVQKSQLDQVINEQQLKISGGLGGNVVTTYSNNEPSETVYGDTNDVKTMLNCMRVNKSGIAFSNNGYSGPYNSAWTIDGKFNADFIQAGHINGNLITGNTIKAGALDKSITDDIANSKEKLINLQDQVDGLIETWSGADKPTLLNYPAVDWNEKEKKNHIGDLYYDANNKCYRFMQNDDGTFTWKLLADTDVTKAIADATKALDATNNSIAGVTTEWYASESPTELYGGTWSEEKPEWNENNYIWSRSKAVTQAGVISYSQPSCVQGNTGAKGDKGEQGKQGIPGVKGTDGKTYYTWIKYADSPTSGMSDNPSGKKYLGVAYNKTSSTESTTYSDYSWSLIKGDKGDTGDKGATGNGIKSIVYTYARTTSQTAPSADSITATTMPTIDATNKYLWQKEVITYTNGQSQTTVLLLAVYGNTGSKGDKGDPGSTGKDGTSVTITSQAITYQASSSGTTVPTGTWVANPPSVAKGQYLWTRTVVNYSDGKKTTAYSVGYQGTNGQNGQNGSPGRGLKSTEITYQIWANGTSTPNGTWTTTVPDTTADKPYLWTRTVITYTDNTRSTSYSVGSTLKGVNVGGRNLILKSKDLSSFLNESSANVQFSSGVFKRLNTNDGSAYGIYYFYTPVIQNTVYTASINIKNINGTIGFGIGGNNGWRDIVQASCTTNGVHTLTFKTTSSHSKIRFYVFSTHVNTTCTLSEAKLELGNIATDWTPAPEDVDADINSVNNAASVAQDTANKAMNNAIQAQGTSTDAFNKANQAQSSANAASNKAETAITSSKEAQSLATQAQSLANKANSDAYNAMEAIKAQNQVFYADSTGAHIRKAGTNNETRVVADGVEIIADNTKVAEFTKTQGRVSNLVADKFLYVGAHRLEKFTQDGEVGTGFFWTGGAL
nr:MAG TPA: tail protein [Caudoviricetes sp.]